MKKTINTIAFSTLLMIFNFSVSADNKTDAENLVNDSLKTLTHFTDDPEMTGFREHILHAKGLFIVPRLIKAGIGIGGSGGSGVILRHNFSNQQDLSTIDQWSNPAFYGMGSINLGIQLGGEIAETVLLIMTDRGMDALLANKLQLGADASIAIGPTGVGIQTATSDVLQYSRAKGFFGGLTAEGSVISPREKLNKAYYGKSVSPLEILVKGAAENFQAYDLRVKLASFKDYDGDGIPDYQDKCPNTPYAAKVDRDGCWAYHGVFFDFDQDQIKSEFQPLYDNAIMVLNLNPGLSVQIEGYTDNIGPAEYNLKLSERRAKAVKDYLTAQGIASSRLTVKGYGMANPVASNDTEEGRAYNRRVYFKRTDAD